MKTLGYLLAVIFITVAFNSLASKPDSIITLPYAKFGNLILLEAEVHGKKGNYILDTGIPGVYLNAKYFGNDSRVYPSNIVLGINGKAREVGILPTDLKLNGIKKGIEALVVDLSHIEKNKGLEILGQIGQSIFKKYELLFDLPNSKIQLIPLDRKGNRKISVGNSHAYQVSFKKKGHLPLILVEVKGLELFLGLDSGAECNVIDPRYLEHIVVKSQWKKSANLSSGWQTQKTVAYRVEKMKIGEKICRPMLTVFSSTKELNDKLYGPDMDGIIGVELLYQVKVSINFKKKILCFWEEKEQLEKPKINGPAKKS